jgi:hypothetical protein
MIDEEMSLEESNEAIPSGLPVPESSPTVQHCNRSEQHQQSLAQAMLMDLPELSTPGHQMSPQEQQEHLLQLALDIMSDVDASSFESPGLVSSTSRPRNSDGFSRDKQ